MITRNSALFVALFILVACQPDKSSVSAPPETAKAPPTQSPEALSFVLEGSIRKGDFLSCDGYLVRYGSEIYCVTTVPDDWVPFEFNGQTYYRQPLSVSDE